MIRLSQTLMNIRNIAWIVVEDGKKFNNPTHHLIRRTQIAYCYIAVGRLKTFPVVYFADDDNTYDIRLFDRFIRKVEAIGVWAVGLVAGQIVEAIKHSAENIVNGWLNEFSPKHNWEINMASFAINLRILLQTLFHNKVGFVVRGVRSFEMICAKIQLNKMRQWMSMLFFLVSFLSIVHFIDCKMEIEINRTYCSLSLYALKVKDYEGQPLILIITPTRKTLTPWVVIEYGGSRGDPIERLLKRSSIPFCYLVSPTDNHQFQGSSRISFDEFVNVEVELILIQSWRWVAPYQGNDHAVTLGLAGNETVVAPAVDTSGAVSGWLTKEHQDSQWPLDAPGFAINLSVLLNHSK
uniref:Galactosylgalactosylxylosylprotein 3-beta-glucuronosyltransferase n=1 Tax=Parascaris equorum TaxID=6256 RepID=A0A914S0K2_PAREQ